MKYYTNKEIRDFIKCPQFGYTEYGRWGGLTLEVRETIKRLTDVNESADYIIYDQEKQIEHLNNKIDKALEELKTLHNEDIFDNIVLVLEEIGYIEHILRGEGNEDTNR